MSLMSDEDVTEFEQEQAETKSQKEAAESAAAAEEAESTSVDAESQAEAAKKANTGSGSISLSGTRFTAETDMMIAAGCFAVAIIFLIIALGRKKKSQKVPVDPDAGYEDDFDDGYDFDDEEE